MHSTTIGLDIAKHVFQVHGVDASGAIVIRQKLRRAEVLAFFETLTGRAAPRRGVIPSRRFKLDALHDRLRCPKGRHLVPHSKPTSEGLKAYWSRIRDCRPCPLRAACFRPNARRRAVLLNKDHAALVRARRRHLAWGDRERALYASHRGRIEGVLGEAKSWHGLARAVRRGLDNMRIQAYLTAAVINLKRLSAALRRTLLPQA